MTELIELLGADHVLFGSDSPHAEGRKSPRHFDDELAGVSDADLRKILHANTTGLLQLR